MKALFKILSMMRWVQAASKGKLPQRYVRVKALRAINRRIR
jgi:hypothetical protein